MVTPGRITEQAPIHTLSPIFTGFDIGLYMSFNELYGALGLAVVKIVTRNANVEFSPMSIRFFATKKQSAEISARFFRYTPPNNCYLPKGQ